MKISAFFHALALIVVHAALLPAAAGFSIHDIFDSLGVSDGKPVWGGLQLDMTAEEVARVVGAPVSIVAEECEGCPAPRHSTTVTYGNRSVHLSFEESEGEEPRVCSIEIRRVAGDSAAAWGRSRLLEQAKRRLAGLRYRPSRHDPERTESDADWPAYTIPSSPDVLVNLEPGFGIEIAYPHLFD